MKSTERIIIGMLALITTVATRAPSADLTITSFAAYAGQTNIVLQATGNVMVLGGSLPLPALPPDVAAGQLSILAGNNLTLNNGTSIAALPGWSVSLAAGNTMMLGGGSGVTTAGGAITLNAAMVSLNGLIQANGTNLANGLVEIIGSNSLILGASSVISANGDATALTGSPGGFVVLQSGNAYVDTPASAINVSGENGGQNGIVEISFGTGTVQSRIGNYLVFLNNPLDLTLSSNPTTAASAQPNLNVNDLAAFSQIALFAPDNIELNTVWTLATMAVPATVTLTAGNNLLFDAGAGLNAGNDWNVNLTAGASLANGSQPTAGSDGIYLNGNSYLRSQNGNLNLWAANEVLVGSGGITTWSGGNIGVTAQLGNVNTGSNPQGYAYRAASPFYSVSQMLGGVGTAAGGNLAIHAGGNVSSYLPSGSSSTTAADGGTGAFGPYPGNITITAGGNVYGHYVLANGVGTITAGNNVGAQSGNPFALSLIAGSWSVNAPNGTVYLQEVRNPNGVFNTAGNSSAAGYHGFNYDPQASVSLNAVGVYLTGLNLPRPSGNLVPVVYPPTLNLIAASGGVTLQGNTTLFPSPNQNLSITTTAGGNLLSAPNNPGTIPELLLSDSSQSRWINSATFSDTDHATSVPVQAGSPNPVALNISGSLQNLNLITSKATQIAVAGSMMNCGFSGQNLQATDVSSITVAGQIFNQSAYAFVTLPAGIPALPPADLPPGSVSAWNTLFNVALKPLSIAGLTVPTGLSASAWTAYALQNAALFPSGVNPGFVYDPATGQLGFGGPMPASVLSSLTQPLTVLRYDANGFPVVDGTGHFVTDTVTWAAPAQLQALSAASQGNPSPASGQLGYRIGGPGQFQVVAGSISLGNTYGILSCGVADPQGGFSRYANLASLTPSGATVNIQVSGNLDTKTSTIAAIGGGNVNLTSTGGAMDLGFTGLSNQQRPVGYGVFTSGTGNVSVLALGDIDINGSRIATYDGGNIFVESLQGNVNAGSGGDNVAGIVVSYVNPTNGAAELYAGQVDASGIVALTLPNTANVPDSASLPGNITVETPQGNIISSQAGILQENLNGSLPAGPTITLVAGTPGFAGDIDLGNSGVIGGTINLQSSGSITGLVLPTQSSNFSTAAAGTIVQFNTAALGTPPFTYQWFKGGTVLPGQTNASLCLTNVQRTDAAVYSVVVSNAVAVATNQFQLHVLVPQQLSAALAPAGNPLWVSFSDVGGGLLTAQDIPTFVIQTSTDLVNWTTADDLPVTANASGGLSFQVPLSASPGCGFFRVLSQ